MTITPKDTDPFPFGKHKGKKYEEIPDGYFIWLIDQKWIEDWPAVWAYIKENFKDHIA